MMKHLHNHLKEPMSKGQDKNSYGSYPLPTPQQAGNVLNTSRGRNHCRRKRILSFHNPLLTNTVQGNVTETKFGGISKQTNEQTDWISAFQSNTELSPTYLVKWIVIVSEEYVNVIDSSIRNMMKHFWPNKWQILAFKIIKLNNNLILPYLRNIEDTLQDGKDFQMLFIILSNHRLDVFFAVTERLKNVDLPAKCLLANDAISHGLLSVAITNTVELKKKVGNEGLTWSHMIPFQNLMVVGFDVYKAKGSNISTGAMVSIGTDSHFSNTFTHQSQEELFTNFYTNIISCCYDYKWKKGFLPDRIIIFRCGVNNDNLRHIKMSEFLNILKEFYWSEGKQIPQLSYIVVANKISSSMLSYTDHTDYNASPNSFFHHNVAKPLRYHFFLIPKIVHKVVRPTSFFVLHDTQGIMPEQMQLIVNQMCHFHYNSSGISSVPISCMFAYKLAFMMGIAHEKLAYIDPEHNLTFL